MWILEKWNILHVVGGGALVLSVTALAKKVYCSCCKKDALKKDWPADTVILHQIGRAPWAPSMSPFPMKLETYLRMANIPYQNDHCAQRSSKGKTPWITYNGQDVADSQFCIDYLNDRLGVDLSKHLTPKEKAISRAFLKLTEENLYWSMMMQRYKYDQDWSLFRLAWPHRSTFQLYKLAWKLQGQAWGHGMGRHDQQEVYAIGRADMEAISVYLGEKKYLMGARPSEVDCAVFGMLALVKWLLPGSPHLNWMTEDFPNLSNYCERMKTEFWPDWDNCITHGGSKTK